MSNNLVSMNRVCSLLTAGLYFIIIFFSLELALGQETATPLQGTMVSEKSRPITAQPSPEVPVDLSIYGHNLLTLPDNLIKATLSTGSMMFPEHYRLGTGDRLGIYLLGKIQQNFEVIVNVEGKIYIPTVGIFYIANLTIQELQNFLAQRLLKYYENFSLNVMLLDPKQIPVMVVGEVNRPGKYFLSSLNTVLDAVIMAGGPSNNGSLRNIEVYRNDELLKMIDFYQFLMTGKIQNEIFLQEYDRIVVPLIKDVVSITGEVRRQAKFELKSGANERLKDLIYLAGGFTDLSFLNKIEISRLLLTGERSVFYADYREIMANDSCESNPRLKNDDRIKVFSILDQSYPKYVFIHGEVKKPGQYPFEENLHVLDLILKAGNLTRSAYVLECEVAKIDPKSPAVFKKINLQNLFNNPTTENNIVLEEDDRLFIRQIPEWEVGLTVEVQGEVQFPGIYAITKDSTKLSEIIAKTGGFTHKALIRDASLIRKSSRIFIDKEYERLRQIPRDQMKESEYQYLVMKENTQDIGQIVVDFYKLCVLQEKSEDLILEDGDVIKVPRAPDVVYVTGRIGKPGGVLYNPGKGTNYYLRKAGGASWDAKVSRIKVTKVTGEIQDDEDIKKLEPGDIIWVPRKPDRDWWELFRQTIAIIAQLATVYIIVDSAIKK